MEHETNIKNSVLQKIQKGEISMRSRAYFVAEASLIGTLLVITAVLSIFALSFILFSLRESGEHFLLGFGLRGVLTFIGLFPWMTLLAILLLLLLVEALLRHFRFGYRVPIIRALVLILAGTVIIGLLVNFTPLHSFLLSEADHGELPVVGELYETIHAPHRDHGVYRGSVTSIAGNQFVISHDDNDRDTDDGTWTVIPPHGFSIASLRAGEHVFVAGSLVASGTVQAYGVEQYGRTQEMK